jgi:epoxide hydrolase-like predicted phosphatase
MGVSPLWYREPLPLPPHRKESPMSRSFDAVLFDYGGVFINSPFPALERAALEIGADPPELLLIMFGPYEKDTDHPWQRLERGELSIMEARDELTRLCQRAGIEVDPLQLLASIMGPKDEPKDVVMSCVRELRRDGYRTALVTNNVREARDRWRVLLRADELFDVVVDSSEIGVRKPDPAIYHRALDLLGGIEPDRAIFLDDVQSNLDAAERLGMRGIRVEDDPSRALQELRSLLAAG